jgi:serine/threonine protein kinase
VKKINHRDVKPPNILVDLTDLPRYRYKISDFGSCRVLMQRGPTSVNVNSMADIEGTVRYMAPELRNLLDKKIYQFDTSNVNLEKVDVYSLGVVAY